MSAKSYPSFAVLLVDDEPAWLRSLPVILERNAGITNVLTCQDSRLALEMIEQHNVGLVLLDHTMPHLSGEELLRQIAERHPQIITIIISGLNQLETAVQCMKHGAFDYFVKTLEEDRLISGILRAVRMLELQQENRAVASHLLSGELNHPEAFGEIVTCDRAMQTIFAYIEAVAPSPQPLLITGESGVGKELIARAAHQLSGRSGALMAVNVAGLDDTVFADTLFGHVRGAFTGADQARRGMVEEAADGTLFLDEIGDLGISSQIKLLRLLQEGEYFPLGSDRPKRLRARVIVATHGDLAAREAAGTFRRDLYYRLRTHSVHVPALRERKGDIPLLLNHFLGEAARSLGKKKPTPPKELAQLLAAYSFPGNVRQLRSMVYDAVTLHKERVLSMDSFVKAISTTGGGLSPLTELPLGNPFAPLERLPTFNEVIELLIDEAMARSSGNQTIAARLLGVSQPALSKRLKSSRK